jgi:hypothetical protein
MARSSLRARGVLASCFVALPAATLLVVACSSSSTSGTPDTGLGGFGDATTPPPKHDATTPRHDSGGGKPDTSIAEGGHDAQTEASGVGSLCTSDSQCTTGSCEPVGITVPMDADVQFDAGICSKHGACECASATCHDGVKNGQETAIDCGGSQCVPCPVGSACSVGSDCNEGECGVGYKGAKCTGFGPDAGMVDGAAPTDAGLASCVCESSLCSDGVKNGDETDVDCGGSCNKCPTGKACKAVGDCTSDICTSDLCACPAGMTEAPTSNSVPYCIDTYEVTYTQYSSFVGGSTTQTLADQPAECAWNTTFVPANNWPQVGNEAKNPVNYVNWCDAFAYCSYVGHHLCGAIANPTTMSPGGTPIPLTEMAVFQDASVLAANDPAIDEWYNACSSQGQNTWPYSNTYQATWCNDIDSPAQQTSGLVEIPIGQLNYKIVTGAPSCILDTSCAGASDQAGVLSTVSQGDVVQCLLLAPTMGATPACGNAFTETGCVGGSSINIVYDLAGNVAEWENSCSASAGSGDSCAVRGGGYDTPNGPEATKCASNAAQPAQPRNTQAADIGFRCCL